VGKLPEFENRSGPKKLIFFVKLPQEQCGVGRL
jgi:hypothetical protein